MCLGGVSNAKDRAAAAPVGLLVAWFSHKSGGSNAHLLPEVPVNTDTHLDLFDSESEDASDFEELIEVQANG